MPVIIGIDPMPVARVADPELATIKPRDIGAGSLPAGPPRWSYIASARLLAGRRLSNVVYARMLNDQKRREAAGPGRALGGDRGAAVRVDTLARRVG